MCIRDYNDTKDAFIVICSVSLLQYYCFFKTYVLIVRPEKHERVSGGLVAGSGE